jgi:hypothetical protein
MGAKDMRHVTAMTAAALMVLVACLGVAGTSDAQAPQTVQLQGTLQAVDCQTGQVTLGTGSGSNSFQATNQTGAFVNGAAVDFCSLQSYAGDSATAVLIPTGGGFELTQINVSAAPARAASGSTLSPAAIGIGALLVGGLIGYILGHQSQPAYYPVGYAPGYLPANYPYHRAYVYQGHSYYRCSGGGWYRDRNCAEHH